MEDKTVMYKILEIAGLEKDNIKENLIIYNTLITEVIFRNFPFTEKEVKTMREDLGLRPMNPIKYFLITHPEISDNKIVHEKVVKANQEFLQYVMGLADDKHKKDLIDFLYENGKFLLT
jgi:hypothetical protein